MHIFAFAEYVCHVFVRSDSLGGVLVSDLEYPQRVVFTLLNKVSIKIIIPFHTSTPMRPQV